MKVTTLNLANYKNWLEREPSIVSYFDEQDSEIVFLQEVMFNHKLSPLTQSKHLNSRLSTPYEYTSSSISRYHMKSNGAECKEGLAVLSKYPIVSSETIVLTKQPDDKHTRLIQIVEIIINENIVTFTNVHFSNNKYAVDQLSETLQILENAGSKSIILGDFNIFDINSVRDLYADKYIVSTDFAQYVSFPSENVTLDYVLMPRDYTFKSLVMAEGLSDHNALTFEFSLQ